MRILLAEDEAELANALKYLLEKNKYTVDVVGNGLDAYDYATTVDYDGIVLDIMMPGMDGLSVLRGIRDKGLDVPVMMLTAKVEVDDKVKGLTLGADDYMGKPFSTREFLARVMALVRRRSGYTSETLTFGNTSLDCNSYELLCGENRLRFGNKEFQIVELFFRNPRKVFSSEYIMERVWQLDSDTGIDVVWTNIGYIRKKLKEIGSNLEIKTVRGAGYMLDEL